MTFNYLIFNIDCHQPKRKPTKYMKKYLLTFILVATVIVANAQTATHQAYTQKTANKVVVTAQLSKKILKEIKSGKAYLVDVRTPEEYSTKHLQYAQNINIRSEKFADEIKQLDKSKKIYLYCRSGNRSGKAADTLQTFGYNFGYNIGALDSLVVKGLPVEK